MQKVFKLFLERCIFFRTKVFEGEFIKDLHLVMVFGKFGMIGHLSLNFESLKIADFYKTNQITNDFDSVLKKVGNFFYFRTEMF